MKVSNPLTEYADGALALRGPALAGHAGDTSDGPSGLTGDGIDPLPAGPLDPDAPATARAGAVPRWVDFYELTKPRMNFLVIVTTVVGFYMASDALNWVRLLHTVLGTALTAASASILNQYLERRYDALMPRTARRPLPAGRVSPLAALAYGVALGTVGVLYLMWRVNPLTAALGAVTLTSYVFLYTPLKRVTTLCTVVGAVPGAIPPVMGWAAASGTLAPGALALFGILFLWQMPHFLAIAILYRDDYAAGGFKMLPVVDEGLESTSRQIVVYGLSLVPASLMPVGVGLAGLSYCVGAVVLGLSFASFGFLCALTRRRSDARKLFFASIIYLPLLLALLVIAKV